MLARVGVLFWQISADGNREPEFVADATRRKVGSHRSCFFSSFFYSALLVAKWFTMTCEKRQGLPPGIQVLLVAFL